MWGRFLFLHVLFVAHMRQNLLEYTSKHISTTSRTALFTPQAVTTTKNNIKYAAWKSAAVLCARPCDASTINFRTQNCISTLPPRALSHETLTASHAPLHHIICTSFPSHIPTKCTNTMCTTITHPRHTPSSRLVSRWRGSCLATCQLLF